MSGADSLENASDGGHALKDPVCGVRVDPQGAAARDEYEGIVFYFCSHACYERFIAKPEFYAVRWLGSA